MRELGLDLAEAELQDMINAVDVGTWIYKNV